QEYIVGRIDSLTFRVSCPNILSSLHHTPAILILQLPGFLHTVEPGHAYPDLVLVSEVLLP
ncbi:hypothetical protein J6590_075174, partial [Homalodisca vitripennis]